MNFKPAFLASVFPAAAVLCVMFFLAPLSEVVFASNGARQLLLLKADGGGATADGEPWSGYTLIAPITSTDISLLDNDKNTVFTWTSSYRPAHSTYLLDDGRLLRACTLSDIAPFSQEAASGGLFELLDTDSTVLWSYTHYEEDSHCPHHDMEYLPNGNLLMIVWEYKNQQEAREMGRKGLADGELWPDSLVEIDIDTGKTVWEWKAWDHLVQNEDTAKPNYGSPSDYPERIDVNYYDIPNADWLHFNAVTYNPLTDQVMVSVHTFSEIWVIDHSTTTEEASGSSGGTYGKGGDILYRWGNPAAYGAGTSDDQQLFGQHDPLWIAEGLPGAGNILIYNNGQGRKDGDYSTVVEIAPPETNGVYAMDGDTYGPSSPAWKYKADPATDFYSPRISGAQRLENGNTLICEGETGRVFEVTSAGEIVWEYAAEDGGKAARMFRAPRYDLDYAGLPSL